MRKLYMFNMMTLDGFFAGPQGEIDWHNVDSEFDKFAIDQLNETGTLIFGRTTYQLMADFWPSETALKSDPLVAEKMNSIAKIVVSKTMKSTDWENTTLISHVGEIKKLKEKRGKDMAVFGSANLATTLRKHGLIDEYRIMVNPVLLGKGKPLFPGLEKMLPLKLESSRSFHSGNMLLTYTPIR